MPAIPYLVPEFVSVTAKNSVPHCGVHFPLFLLGFAHSRIFRLFRVSAFPPFRFSRVQIRNSGFSVFPFFPAFPVLRGPNPEFQFFHFFSAATFGAHRTMVVNMEHPTLSSGMLPGGPGKIGEKEKR